MEKINKKLPWIISLKGIIAISLSIVLWFSPTESWSNRLVPILLLDGVFSFVYSLSGLRRQKHLRLSYFIEGIATCCIVAVIVKNPVLEADIIIFLFSIWLTFNGFSQIGLARFLKNRNRYWLDATIIGIMSIVAGLFFMPPISNIFSTAIVYLATVIFIFGISLEFIAIRILSRPNE